MERNLKTIESPVNEVIKKYFPYLVEESDRKRVLARRMLEVTEMVSVPLDANRLFVVKNIADKSLVARAEVRQFRSAIHLEDGFLRNPNLFERALVIAVLAQQLGGAKSPTVYVNSSKDAKTQVEVESLLRDLYQEHSRLFESLR